MHIQKLIGLFCIVSVALGNTKSSGMEQGNAPYIEEGSKRLIHFQIMNHNNCKYRQYHNVPITIQSDMANHIRGQIYNRMQQEGFPLPEGGFKLICYGKDLLELCNNDDEKLDKELFAFPKSLECRDMLTVVPKSLSWHPQLHQAKFPQKEPAQSWLSTIMSIIKNFE